jgi:hypothetical protein
VRRKLPRRSDIASPTQPIFPLGPFFPGYGLFGFGDSFFGYGYGFGSGLGINPGCDPSSLSGCDAGGMGDTYGYYTNDDFDSSDGASSPDSGNSANDAGNAASVVSNPATSDEQAAAQSEAQPPVEDVVNIWQDPPAPPAIKRDQFAAEKSLVVLYLNDGSVYAVTNCWVAGGKLHYHASYGGENSLELSALDLQRTVNANAARGVDFTLRPTPSAPESAPQNPAQQPN